MDTTISTTEATTLRVSGTATVSAEPDQAVIRFTVTGRSTPPGASITDALERCEAVVDAVRRDPPGSIVLPSVTTRQEAWNDGTAHRRDGDWVAWRTGTITVDVAEAADALAYLVSNGATIDGVGWQLRDRTELERRARVEAVADAHRTAQDLAAAIAVDLRDLVSLDSSSDQHTIDFMGDAAGVMASRSIDISFEPGDVDASAVVTAVWSVGASGA